MTKEKALRIANELLIEPISITTRKLPEDDDYSVPVAYLKWLGNYYAQASKQGLFDLSIDEIRLVREDALRYVANSKSLKKATIEDFFNVISNMTKAYNILANSEDEAFGTQKTLNDIYELLVQERATPPEIKALVNADLLARTGDGKHWKLVKDETKPQGYWYKRAFEVLEKENIKPNWTSLSKYIVKQNGEPYAERSLLKVIKEI